MRLDRSSLKTRARVVYGTVAVIGILGVLLSASTFERLLEQRRALADHIDPAALAAQRWLGAYLNQESGVRGYVLSAEPSFLGPYRSGEITAAKEEREVRRLLVGEPALRKLVDTFDARATHWQLDQARPLIGQTSTNGATQVSDKRLRESKVAFDGVRAAYLRLASRLDAARRATRDRLAARSRDLAIFSSSAVALLGFGVAGTWVMLNRWVLLPLARLGADARIVADGDLDHEVSVLGAPEIAALGRDMESMRQRILAEVAVVDTARVRLMEQAADLERSNQELEQFAYVASHDLQEPLRKISGFCQLLERRYKGQLDDRADEYIGFAVDGAKRMQRLINDLLAFSRVGRTTASFLPVDLAAIAAIAVHTMREQIEESGARVDIGPLPTVPGDPTLLEVLIQNLIGNAIKFRGDDPTVVAIRAEPDGDLWQFTCSDNGIGIEPDYAERVFVIFQRLHTRETYEGTGIGLAMCRKIVEFHGGHIHVDLDPDRPGTTIRWTLPATPTETLPATPTETPTETPTATPTGTPTGTPTESAGTIP
ncbi:MAG: SpoIIE family protein phosphatase [Acidimicrobiales bacterium]|nr:SpoIIE family protein phosphatase [Acidimicrobiales bacterium]